MNQHIHIAPPGWHPEAPNPFTPDGGYGIGWSCFHMRDVDDSQIINGRPGGDFCCEVPEGVDDATLEARRGVKPYCFMPGRGVLDAEAQYRQMLSDGLFRGCKVWMPVPEGVDPVPFAGCCGTSIETRLADFLRYETSHGRDVIVSFPPDIDAAEIINRALKTTPGRETVRPNDPRWWVHSTTRENWVKIRECGELRSFSRMRREKGSPGGIGLFSFGEPADYADYVMLGSALGIGPEHVVSSQQKGFLITEEDTPYTPGVRLYFDGHRIIRDGLAVSDGLHLVKVRDHLPLEPYLTAAVIVSDVDLAGDVQTWTPWTFLNASNVWFMEKVC